MNKGLSLALSLLTVMVLINGCSEPIEPLSDKDILVQLIPEDSSDYGLVPINWNEVALGFIKSETFYDVEGMKSFLAQEDIDNFVDPLASIGDDTGSFLSNEFLVQWQNSFADQFSFEVKDSEYLGDLTAKVTITISLPDILGQIGTVFANALKFGAESSPESLINGIDTESIPKVTVDKIVNLILENDEWKVVKNYGLEQLIKEAKKLESDKELSKALSKVSSVLEIDPDNPEANKLASSIQDELAIEKEKVEYYEKIKIFEFEAKMFKSTLYGETPGVKFAIQNLGDKTLTQVGVIVYFYDDSGLPIAEEKFYPILVTEYCFSDCDPLRPNYIHRMGSNFYRVEKVGPEWSGKADIEIIDIEFE